MHKPSASDRTSTVDPWFALSEKERASHGLECKILTHKPQLPNATPEVTKVQIGISHKAQHNPGSEKSAFLVKIREETGP